jgi:hypothetical protein
MADFIKERKKQKYLVYVFIVILFGIFLVFWFGFLRKPETMPPVKSLEDFKFKKVEIDFSLLKEPALKELKPFETIKPFEGNLGRENPFLPY